LGKDLLTFSGAAERSFMARVKVSLGAFLFGPVSTL
jgi:hypothetical protein